MSEWAKAFVAAQAEMPQVVKDKTATVRMKQGGTYQYSYADLSSIVEKLRPHLATHGLAVAQDVETVEGYLHVNTLIIHSSGERESFGPIIFPGGNDAQSAGSAITYARRYALCAALNIAAEDDDDGQQASKSRNSAGSSAPSPAVAPAKAPPKHSVEGVTQAATQTPVETQAVAKDVTPSSDHSQKNQGVAPDNKDGRVDVVDTSAGERPSVPPGSSDWLQLIETYTAATVLHAAQIAAKEAKEKPPFTKKALNELPPAILEQVSNELAQRERVA